MLETRMQIIKKLQVPRSDDNELILNNYKLYLPETMVYNAYAIIPIEQNKIWSTIYRLGKKLIQEE